MKEIGWCILVWSSGGQMFCHMAHHFSALLWLVAASKASGFNLCNLDSNPCDVGGSIAVIILHFSLFEILHQIINQNNCWLRVD